MGCRASMAQCIWHTSWIGELPAVWKWGATSHVFARHALLVSECLLFEQLLIFFLKTHVKMQAVYVIIDFTQ